MLLWELRAALYDKDMYAYVACTDLLLHLYFFWSFVRMEVKVECLLMHPRPLPPPSLFSTSLMWLQARPTRVRRPRLSSSGRSFLSGWPTSWRRSTSSPTSCSALHPSSSSPAGRMHRTRCMRAATILATENRPLQCKSKKEAKKQKKSKHLEAQKRSGDNATVCLPSVRFFQAIEGWHTPLPLQQVLQSQSVARWCSKSPTFRLNRCASFSFDNSSQTMWGFHHLPPALPCSVLYTRRSRRLECTWWSLFKGDKTAEQAYGLFLSNRPR